MRPRLVTAAVIALPLGLAPVVSSAAPPADGPPVVTPEIHSVPLSKGLARAAAVREIDPDQPFAMAAVRWTGNMPDKIEVQPRHTDGTWGEWTELDRIDGAAKQQGRPRASEAVWLGDSTTVRVRATNDDGSVANARALTVDLIDPGKSTTDGIEPKAGVTTGMPPVITRAEWGADEQQRKDCYTETGWRAEWSPTVKAATIHHTAGSNDYTAADSARIVRGIYAYHGFQLDWCDIGYNVLIDKYGQIFEGRWGGLDKPVYGAHAAGFNKYTTGVSMLGDFETAAPTSAMLDSIEKFLAWKFARGYRDPNGTVTLTSSSGSGTSKYPEGADVALPRIFAHRDTGNTECPGDNLYAKLPEIRQGVAELMDDYTTSPVHQRWQATGGDSGHLSGPWQLERSAANGGLRTVFQSGNKTIYWSEGTGAHIVGGAIRSGWLRNGGAGGFLGYPTTDERRTPDGIGRYNHFANDRGSVYWTKSTGAHEIHGIIKAKWADLRWENGPLGYPKSDQGVTPDGIGRYNHFQHGSVYWTNNTGAHGVYGAIKAKWRSLGWERGPLGYPKTDEKGTPDGRGRYNHFQHGSVYWSGATGAHGVYGAIKAKWGQLGWERSWLGYPTSDEFAVNGGRRSNFQHGYIVWRPSTGAIARRY